MSANYVRVTLRTSMFVLCAFLLGVTAGCGGSGSSLDSGVAPSAAASTSSPSTASASASPSAASTTSTTSTSASTAPTISGSPATRAQVDQAYSFTPTVTNPSGAALGFSISNRPAWASFSTATGSLSGTPSTSDVGTDSNIVISASNGQKSAALSPFSITVSAAAGAPLPPSGGASLVFSYPTGFSSASNAIQTVNDAAQFNGSVIDLTNGTVGQHESGAAWYATKLNVASFTTDFTFQISATGYGLCFIIQNDPRGTNAAADANGIGYFQYSNNPAGTAMANSIAIAFNATTNSTTSAYYVGANPSVTGLYVDGGPLIDNGIYPVQDLSPQGINLHSGDMMSAHVVYDGTILSMVLTDTKTGAQAYFSWPVNIPAVVGSDTAYVGFGAGTIPAVSQTVNTWTWWQGYDSRLPSPTFSAAPGSYTSSQSVAISGPTGATIYYTTDGKPPTTASSVYSAPITVSSTELIQAIAVESGYTDSLPTQGYYQIQAAGGPIVNFPSGFAAANGLVQTAGMATISGSNLQLTDGVNNSEIGTAFYAVPLNVQSFTTSFTLRFSGTNTQNGLMFVIQNQLPPSADTAGGVITGTYASSGAVSGGLYAFGLGEGPPPDLGTGYAGIGSSVAVKFDVWNGNTTGLFTNGESPYTPQTSITDVNLSSGDPIDCTLTYNGTTLTLSMKDMATQATFSTNWTVNIPATVGADTAYVGFTAALYGGSSVQDVTAWTYQN